jgi:Rrf2 family protein
MLKISTKGRYALRFMLELSLHASEGPMFLKDAAENQDISEKYLSQLIIPLKNARLINTTRGAHGGYSLARKPRDITVKEIIEAVEGPLTIVECVMCPEVCEKADDCVARDVWASARDAITNHFESLTLEDVLHKEKQRQSKIKKLQKSSKQ